MLGAIAGDIIGSAYERHNTSRYDFELFSKHSTFTDDTVLTVAVMDHLLCQTDLADSLRSWCNRYPGRGYGPGFLAWVGGHAAGHSRGNGAAMRASPVAWWEKDQGVILQKADEQAQITHNSEEARTAAKAVALAIHHSRCGISKPGLVQLLKPYYELSQDWPPTIRKPRGLAKESVPVALQAVLASTSFEDAVRKAVSIGGDSDTIASIAGAVGEAWYGVAEGGVPDWIVQEIRKRLPEEMLQIVDAFRATIEHNKAHEWIACSFLTVVIRGEALSNYPGGASAFAEKHQCRHCGGLVVACSMGGDGHLDEVVDAAKLAGADPLAEMEGFDAYAMAQEPRQFRPKPDGPLDFEPPWLEGKMLGGRVMVRLRP